MKSQRNFILLSVLIGSTLISTIAQAEEKNYESNTGIQFIPGERPSEPLYPNEPISPISPIPPLDAENPVQPIDPTNPDGNPNPGTQGPLTLDYVSSWDFGQQKISTKDEKYYANFVKLQDSRTVQPYIQVSDFRGTNGGWSLFVKQDKQFSNKDLLHSELTGAKLFFSAGGWVIGTSNNTWNRPYTTNGNLVPGEGNVEVFMAPKRTGAMTWIRTMGDREPGDTKDTGISLSIPGKTPKDAGVYRTTLTWTLADVPAEPEQEVPPPLEPGDKPKEDF